MPKVTTTSAFVRDLKRLGKQRKDAAKDALATFMKSPDRTGLNFERVLSRTDYFTIRANRGDRILLYKTAADTYDVVAVGDHDYIYRGYFKNR